MRSIFEKGQSLFEVVVSIAISALIVTAIVAVASNSIQNSSYSKDKTLAAGYVQETMEWVRKERDQNSAVFLTKALPGTNYCLTSLSWTSPVGICSSSQVIGDTKFSRVLSFLQCDTCPVDVVEAKVSVTWRDSKGLHDVSSITDLSTK